MTVEEFVRDGLAYRRLDVFKGVRFFGLGPIKMEQHLFIYPANLNISSCWFMHTDLATLPESDRREVKAHGFRPKHTFMFRSSNLLRCPKCGEKVVWNDDECSCPVCDVPT